MSNMDLWKYKGEKLNLVFHRTARGADRYFPLTKRVAKQVAFRNPLLNVADIADTALSIVLAKNREIIWEEPGVGSGWYLKNDCKGTFVYPGDRLGFIHNDPQVWGDFCLRGQALMPNAEGPNSHTKSLVSSSPPGSAVMRSNWHRTWWRDSPKDPAYGFSQSAKTLSHIVVTTTTKAGLVPGVGKAAATPNPNAQRYYAGLRNQVEEPAKAAPSTVQEAVAQEVTLPIAVIVVGTVPATGLDPAPEPSSPSAPPAAAAPPLAPPYSPPHASPPGKGEREKKTLTRSVQTAIKIAKGLDKLSEAAEVVDAVYEALPADVRARWEKYNKRKEMKGDQMGQYGIDGADWKLKAIWYNWHRLDAKEAIINIAKNEVEDKLYGAAHKAINEMRPRNVERALREGRSPHGSKRRNRKRRNWTL